MTRARLRLATALATVAALAVPAGSTTAGAVACPGVRRSGEAAVIALPAGTIPTMGVTVAGGSGVRGADVLFAATPRTLWRSPDGGCTWSAALSLDADPAPPWRASPDYGLWSVSAAPAGPDGHHTVYAVAGYGTLTLATALPVVGYVSTDDGLHWQVREPRPAAFAGDAPRCTPGDTRILAGTERGTAYLACGDTSFGGIPIHFFGPECLVALYVTHDYAAGWQPLAGRLGDPALVSASNTSGCQEVSHGADIVVDEQSPNTLWMMPACSKNVRRSVDGGRTFAPWADLPHGMYFCAGLDTRVLPRIGRVALGCDPGELLVSTGRPAGETAKPVVKVSEAGGFQGCLLDRRLPRAYGFYLDGAKRCRLYSYDLLRKTFRIAGIAPSDDPGGCAWHYGAVLAVPAPGARNAYATTAGLLIRVGAS